MAKKRVRSQKQVARSQQLRLFFPQILRKITAIHLWRWLVALFIASILILQLVNMAQILYDNYREARLKQAQERLIETEIQKWKRVVAVRPDYRDGYFELAILTYRLGRLDKTRLYLEKVLALDPNYEPARKLEKIVGY